MLPTIEEIRLIPSGVGRSGTAASHERQRKATSLERRSDVLSDVAACLLTSVARTSPHARRSARLPRGLGWSPIHWRCLALCGRCGLRGPTAYHVDHLTGCVAPARRARPRSCAEAAAARLGAAFVSLSRRFVAPGPNLEARAGVRRAWLRTARDGVATGHTADDQAETILLNLVRGAGLEQRPSSGMPGRGLRHPILAPSPCSETERLAASLGIEVVRDPTNADPAFRRNRVKGARGVAAPRARWLRRNDPVPILVLARPSCSRRSGRVSSTLLAVEHRPDRCDRCGTCSPRRWRCGAVPSGAGYAALAGLRVLSAPTAARRSSGCSSVASWARCLACEVASAVVRIRALARGRLLIDELRVGATPTGNEVQASIRSRAG